jgi:predicted ATPase
VLEAFSHLCHEPEGEHVVSVLAKYAPTWLVQMPAFVSAEELEAIRRKVAGATHERMLREMAEALEALTVGRTLVLVLEDLQWSDQSTLELIAYLARRRAPARLLVLGTYRPADVVLRKHLLREIKQELHVHGQCGELRLELLMEENVAEYVDERFAGEAREFAPELTRLVYRRTDGNALFMVNLVNELVTRHVIVQQGGRWELARPLADIEIGLPSSLRRFLEQQLDRLSPAEREMLEAASVVGMGFSAATVSTALETETTQVEGRCADLARREHFLRHCGIMEWPDGAVASCYRFTHALYQEVLYEQIPLGRRVELHRRIGEREEHAYGAHAGEIAAELAMHFERGRDYYRAVHYLHRAGENAIRRNAYREAMLHLTHGLELLTHLPDTPERARQELSLQVALSLPLMATKTPAASEVEKVYRRARDLCEQVGETRELFPALWNLWSCYEARAQWRTARDLAQQLLSMAQDAQDPALLLQAHHAQWTTLINLGELVTAHAHCEQGIALYDPRQYRSQIFLCGGHDPGVCCREMSSLPLWLLGYPDQALKRSYEALTLGQELSHPLSLVGALDRAAMLHQWRGEEQAVQAVAEAAMARSTELGFVFHMTFETVLRGWVLARRGRDQGGIAQIQQGLAARRASGVEVNRPYCLALLAEGYGKVGQVEKGLTTLAEALDVVHKTGERFYEAELYRLKGELTLAQSSVQSLGSRVQENQKAKGKRQKAKIGFGNWELGSGPLPSESPNPKSQIPDPSLEAEACFLKAIDIARQQQARSLELRATTSLARLWQQQGKQHEARNTLSVIYGWFTEGFDTKDLQEAKALLAELSH